MKAIAKKTNDILLNRGNGLLKDIIRDKYLYLLLVPFVLFYLIFMYKPMWGLQIAFKDFSIFRGIQNSPWIGFENFITFFQGPYFWRTLKNTVLINVYSLFWSFPAPIILAILLYEMKDNNYKRLTQTFMYLPHFISIVVVAGLVTNFLSPSNGLINLIISKLGGEKVYFLIRPDYFRTIYITMNIWKEVGFSTIIYVSALTAIDSELYEASVIDGAGKLKQIIHVTIPGIAPTIIIMLILRLGNLLRAGYESIILLYQPATYETADVISTYVYRTGLVDGSYGLATAVGFFDSVVALVLTVIANSVSKKVSETSLW